jgi:DNA replication protein DnaC
MNVNATLDKLRSMRLDGMADAYDRQRSDPASAELSFDQRLAMLVECHWNHEANRAVERRLKQAKLRQNASIEQIDWRRPRGLTKELISQLSTSQWVRYGQDCVITGATGIGKSWLACALAQKACRDGYRALYTYSPKLFRDLLAANADGTLSKLIRRLGKLDLLVIDDLGMEVAKRNQYRDFLELIDERHARKATLITSQYPPENWHEIVGDPTVGDAIVDRLIHRAYRIDLVGTSMRSPDPEKGSRKPDGQTGKTGLHNTKGGK